MKFLIPIIVMAISFITAQEETKKIEISVEVLAKLMEKLDKMEERIETLENEIVKLRQSNSAMENTLKEEKEESEKNFQEIKNAIKEVDDKAKTFPNPDFDSGWLEFWKPNETKEIKHSLDTTDFKNVTITTSRQKDGSSKVFWSDAVSDNGTSPAGTNFLARDNNTFVITNLQRTSEGVKYIRIRIWK